MNRKKRKARNRPKVLFNLQPFFPDGDSGLPATMPWRFLSLYFNANAYTGLHWHNRANH